MPARRWRAAGLRGDGRRARRAAPRRGGAGVRRSDRPRRSGAGAHPRAPPHGARAGAERARRRARPAPSARATRCSSRTTSARRRPRSTSSSGRSTSRRCWIGCSPASAWGSSRRSVAATPSGSPAPASSAAWNSERRRPHRLRQPALGDQRLGHPIAQVIAGALRQDAAAHQPRGRAHATRQIAEPEPEPALLQVGLDHAPEKRLHLPQAVILAAGIAEVVGRIEARAPRPAPRARRAPR